MVPELIMTQWQRASFFVSVLAFGAFVEESKSINPRVSHREIFHRLNQAKVLPFSATLGLLLLSNDNGQPPSERISKTSLRSPKSINHQFTLRETISSLSPIELNSFRSW
ncbi:hypothetical protein SISSUDRAFT_716834 [Sistotremastrum suecicum HHB10207 ss-3]|uniref:Uncharacterized protein n=1 Tax=Sistotremastrum suecicum HHB10207 ss-3 TaxID=1314776 RepID=A0A166DQA8_9AGAM|nr:hypothetical protein SISSUDRAFT_716834 [Sistotremastrum suecicum HHB10207 ss-3]